MIAVVESALRDVVVLVGVPLLFVSTERVVCFGARTELQRAYRGWSPEAGG